MNRYPTEPEYYAEALQDEAEKAPPVFLRPPDRDVQDGSAEPAWSLRRRMLVAAAAAALAWALVVLAPIGAVALFGVRL